MKKRYLAASTALIALLATGCGQEDTDANSSAEEEMVVPISVDLTVPESGEAGEAVHLSAAVTQGDEKVADADDVEYEIWEEGKKEDSWMVKSEQNTDGLYEAEATFEHDGLFHVQVHVTARDMHTMPMKEITIGEGAAEETGEAGHESGHGDHHGEHATEGFSMHFMEPDAVKANEPAMMMVHLQQDDQPLEGARVRLEVVVNDKSDAAQWVKLSEEKPGEYTGELTVDAIGKATVTVHVEDDEGLHEHESHELTISE
ncbi:FixH family protein [Sporosarcina aquimarina]|uniref:FixH family protein n=1 Tax=Sporosarcina aquimarina TaxID=114975 RepID=A0ABU4G1L3_9BACL|nr:FixH family protein [Sporosarcina aquimarina]MDW0110282.1 FixH family protein [Sporosarcina aquimarina]